MDWNLPDPIILKKEDDIDIDSYINIIFPEEQQKSQKIKYMEKKEGFYITHHIIKYNRLANFINYNQFLNKEIERRQKVLKYFKKRKRRVNGSRIIYHIRKNQVINRNRYKGRFTKK